MSFKTNLAVENARGLKKLVKPLIYESAKAGKTVIPEGFPTDLASFSIGNLALRGKTEEAAVVHDWLYSVGACTRAEADAIFREALKAKGVGKVRRTAYWFAVRAFGWKPWKAHRKGWTVGAMFARRYFGTETDHVTNHP